MIIIYGTKQKEETYGLIAKAWDECADGDVIQIIQSNALGGRSLEKKLRYIFPDLTSDSRDKSRYINIAKNKNNELKLNDILSLWRSYNQLQFVEDIGFYSMPGIFGWDKIDRGSQLLLSHTENLKGVGADFGCGYGYLTRNILKTHPDIQSLYAFDIDSRAVEACKKNVTDDRVMVQIQDCTNPIPDLPKLDFIIMNPPFHDGSVESKELGQKFIANAKNHLKPRGILYCVANKHLPYEKILNKYFQSFKILFEGNGFKIFKT